MASVQENSQNGETGSVSDTPSPANESEHDRQWHEFVHGPWTQEHEDIWKASDFWVPDENLADDGCVLLPATDERLVAVLPQLATSGVHAPGEKGKTYDWRRFPGTKRNTAQLLHRAETLPLIEALHRQWPRDAMMLTYLMVHRKTGRHLAWQPRLNKSSIPWIHEQGYDVFATMLVVDIDTPGHRSWTDEDQEEFVKQTAECPTLQKAGIYRTEKGWRAMLAYDKPVPIRDSEEVGHCLLVQLQREGVRVDMKCKDWTHVFRPPRSVKFTKDGKKGSFVKARSYRVDFDPDLSKMTPIDPYDPTIYTSSSLPQMNTVHVPVATPPETNAVSAEAAAPKDEKKKPEKKKPTPRHTGTIRFAEDKDVPNHYHILIDVVARAIHEKVTAGYHHLYLYLSGMLCQKRIAYEWVPAIIRRIATMAEELWRKDNEADGRTWVDEHWRSAIDSCHKHAEGVRTGGFGKLVTEYPGIAEAVEQGLGRSQQRQEIAVSAKLLPIEDARKDLLNRVMACASLDLVTAIKSGCGTGKTHAAEITAIIRANSGPMDQRAPRGSKTVISVDKNRLAKQVTKFLDARGVEWRRYRSPLSVVDNNDQPVCKFHEVGKMLQAGGHSVHYELCEGRGQKPCEYKKNCKAYGQYEGDEYARIAVGNHALIKPMMKSVGTSGYTIIDEPPQLLETTEIYPRELLAVINHPHIYSTRYYDLMIPTIFAFGRWMATAPLNEEHHVVPVAKSMAAVLAEGAMMLTDDEMRSACAAAMTDFDNRSNGELIMECVRRALPEDRKGTAPPTRTAEMLRAHTNPGLATQIGMASKVLKFFYEAIVERMDVDERSLRQTVRIQERLIPGSSETERVAYITGARKNMVEALREPGPRLLIDANADLHIPVLKRVLYQENKPFLPQVFQYEAGDRSRVDRYIAPLPYSSRAGWIVGGRLAVKYIVAAVERALVFAMKQDMCGFLGKEPKDRQICIISYKRVAAALRATRNPESELIVKAWHKMGGTDAQLAELKKELGPVLSRWTGGMLFGHYYGLRGMDDTMKADTFVTLGDPWPSVGEIRNEVAFLNAFDGEFEGPGVKTETMSAEERSLAYCRAEGEQAHGRARTTERMTPCLALHVGRIRPGGHLWASNDVTELAVPPGRRPMPIAMEGNELVEIRQLLNITQREVAERIGVSERTIRNYESGSVPPAAADSIRNLLQEL